MNKSLAHDECLKAFKAALSPVGLDPRDALVALAPFLWLEACDARFASAAAWCRDAFDFTNGQIGQNAVSYGIGLGNLLLTDPPGGGAADPTAQNGETRIAVADPRVGQDAGDALLRCIANVSLGHNPDPSAGPDPWLRVSPPGLITQADPRPPTLAVGDLSYLCGHF